MTRSTLTDPVIVLPSLTESDRVPVIESDDESRVPKQTEQQEDQSDTDLFDDDQDSNPYPATFSQNTNIWVDY